MDSVVRMLAIFAVVSSVGCGSVSICDNTPVSFDQSQSDTYEFRLSVDDGAKIFHQYVDAHIVLDGMYYPMRRIHRGAFAYKHEAVCVRQLPYHYLIHFGDKDSSSRIKTMRYPESGEFITTIACREEVVFSHKTPTLRFDCRDSSHPWCVSDYIIITNRCFKPVAVTQLAIQGGLAPHDPYQGDNTGKYFSVLPNSHNPPIILGTGQCLMMVVCFQHQDKDCSGTLVISTDHPQYREFRVALEGRFHPPAKQVIARPY